MILVKLFPTNENQRIILEKSIEKNSDEFYSWFLRYLIVPGLINTAIVFIIYMFSASSVDFWSILFNGRFSLLGINVFSAMLVLLISKTRTELKDIETDTYGLKKKLATWGGVYLVLISFACLIQSIYIFSVPLQFIDYVLGNAVIILLFVLGMFNSAYSYMVTDEMLVNAIDVIISNNVKKLGDSIDEFTEN